MKHAFSKKLLALTLAAVLALSAVLILTPAAEEGEAAYISDGMVAWYDGVDNEANGTHNNDATVWQNKVNPTEAWTITLALDADDHFTDEGFTIHDNRQFFPQSVVDVINGEAWTLEISLGDFVGLGKCLQHLHQLRQRQLLPVHPRGRRMPGVQVRRPAPHLPLRDP